MNETQVFFITFASLVIVIPAIGAYVSYWILIKKEPFSDLWVAFKKEG